MLTSKIVHLIVICSLKFTLMQTETRVRGKRKHDSVQNINGLSQYMFVQQVFYPHGHKLKTKQNASRFNFGRGVHIS